MLGFAALAKEYASCCDHGKQDKILGTLWPGVAVNEPARHTSTHQDLLTSQRVRYNILQTLSTQNVRNELRWSV
jgi:hypothetical protein